MRPPLGADGGFTEGAQGAECAGKMPRPQVRAPLSR